MTGLSALISHNVIMKNNRQIEAYKLKSQAVSQTIKDHWEGIRRLERDGNIALLMSIIVESSPQLPDSTHKNVRLYIEQLVSREGNKQQSASIKKSLAGSTAHPGVLFPELQGFISQTRKNTINIIDREYLEKITLQEKIEKLEQKNSSYSIIALFLQVMGLILVLSKDLARKTWPN